MSWEISVVLLIGFVAWAYRPFRPPPPCLCGTKGGPPLVGPRIKLRDGRNLSYKEHGVPKEAAKYKVILVHGFSSSKREASITATDLVEKLGIYFVSFDRPGYGESDPDPQRTIKSLALDIEELGHQLELGAKFYIIGTSMGGQAVWGCLKYIPHRLKGAALLAPVVNYWWPCFPSALAAEAYNLQPVQDQWALRVARHAPWLVYWWNTQKWFPGSSVAAGTQNFTAPDLQIIAKMAASGAYATQQGLHESYHRDMMVGFGHRDLDPMQLEDPFPHGEGSVHLWHGTDDGVVPVSLQRYIAEKLPWVQYHEGPSVEGPRIRLRDGRHLAYMEHGVSKVTANYKIILVHGFGSNKNEAHFARSVFQALVEKLGIHLVSFDRPGYGESDPDPKRTMESIALDIEELGDKLELGPKFYIIGTSMGGQVVWGCLKYIPHRLAGVAMIAPVVNFWWPGFPAKLATEAYYEQFPQDQWALRVAHYAPSLVYWWNTQKWFPPSSVAAGRPNFTAPDLQVLAKLSASMVNRHYSTQQGLFESLHRDMMIGFGSWGFDPMDLDNPFLDREGSVHLWQGDNDGLVPVTLQRYIAKKLPWIQYHEMPNAGHLFPHGDTTATDAILNALLVGDK
ncbi:uncharacterized protein LOC121744708 [Salvia splendens]|uniref:uncharacterized protein LOC121744708 n=1 Tax=Salvia splendens TaxID=180675 RepID=UPI001C258334|nr:uncharacterized protein LOC121744708 [Salvia splendens]